MTPDDCPDLYPVGTIPREGDRVPVGYTGKTAILRHCRGRTPDGQGWVWGYVTECGEHDTQGLWLYPDGPRLWPV